MGEFRDNRLGVKGWFGGRLGPEKWAYFFQRITGILIFLYLLLHILVTSTRAIGADTWERTMGAVSGPIFRFLEYLLIVLITFHAFNGIRLIATELFGLAMGKPRRPVYPYTTSVMRQRPLYIGMMVLAAIFLVLTAWGFLAKP